MTDGLNDHSTAVARVSKRIKLVAMVGKGVQIASQYISHGYSQYTWVGVSAASITKPAVFIKILRKNTTIMLSSVTEFGLRFFTFVSPLHDTLSCELLNIVTDGDK